MTEIVKLPQNDELGRNLFHLFIPKFEDFPKVLKLPSKYFVLLFVYDVDLIEGKKLLSWADTLIDEGLAYFCTWGKDCQETENAVDIACVKKHLDKKDEYDENDSVIMTTSHQDDSFEEFLWFGLMLSYPDEKYDKECKSILIVVVKNESLNKHLLSTLSDVKEFNKMMIEEENDNEQLKTNN